MVKNFNDAVAMTVPVRNLQISNYFITNETILLQRASTYWQLRLGNDDEDMQKMLLVLMTYDWYSEKN